MGSGEYSRGEDIIIAAVCARREFIPPLALARRRKGHFESGWNGRRRGEVEKETGKTRLAVGVVRA